MEDKEKIKQFLNNNLLNINTKNYKQIANNLMDDYGIWSPKLVSKIVNLFNKIGVDLTKYNMFNVDDKVKVVNTDQRYTTYDSFFIDHNLHDYLKIYKNNRRNDIEITPLKDGQEGTVLYVTNNTSNFNPYMINFLYVIEVDGLIYLINQKGLKKV